jgi:hypothetical protein
MQTNKPFDHLKGLFRSYQVEKRLFIWQTSHPPADRLSIRHLDSAP